MKTLGAEPLYTELKCELVPSNHGTKGINYRVFLGYVNWNRSKDNGKPAIVVFMQYGNTEIALHMPAHILIEDLELVMEAVRRLSR
jgi:hypothetical protein